MNPFVIEHSAEELDLTAEFQSHMVALSAVTLKSFSAHRADQEPEVREGLQLDLKHQARHCDVSDGKACFDVSMVIEALADGDREKPLFHVDCVFELVCELEERFCPSEEQLTAFQRGNAVFVCWPYMREFVQNATSRLGLSVPPIPPLRILGKQDAPVVPALATTDARGPKAKRHRAAKRPA